MDAAWYRDINRFAVHTTWLHGIMKLLAVDGIGLFVLVVLVAWWWARSSRHATKAVAATAWAALGALAALGLNQFIVHAVARKRPFVTLSGVEVLVHKSRDFSFPSDHAVTAGAATMGVWIAASYGPRLLRRVAMAATALALLIAFARVYVGVHYPSDVVVGLLVGAAISLLGWLMLQGLLTAITGTLAQSRALRPLVVARAQSWRGERSR